MLEKDLKIAVILLFLSSPLLFSQTETEANIAAASSRAFGLFFKINDLGFFRDNYEKSFDKIMDSVGTLSFMYSFGAMMNGVLNDQDNFFLTDKDNGYIASRIVLRNLGFDFLSFNIDADGILLSNPGLYPVFPVDSAYYKPSVLKYDIQVEGTIGGFLRLGFSTVDFSEFYKSLFADPEDPILKTDLSGMKYQKYSLSIVNFQAIKNIFPGLGSVEEKFEDMLNRMGLQVVLLVSDYLNPSMLNGTYFTGIPYLPLVSTLYMKDQPEVFLNATVALPIFGATLTVEPGVTLLRPSFYKLGVNYDVLGLVVPLISSAKNFSSWELAQEYFSWKPNNKNTVVLASGGPWISYVNYSGFADDVFPYQMSYFTGNGVKVGFKFGAHAVTDKFAISWTMEMDIGDGIAVLFPNSGIAKYFMRGNGFRTNFNVNIF